MPELSCPVYGCPAWASVECTDADEQQYECGNGHVFYLLTPDADEDSEV